MAQAATVVVDLADLAAEDLVAEVQAVPAVRVVAVLETHSRVEVLE